MVIGLLVKMNSSDGTIKMWEWKAGEQDYHTYDDQAAEHWLFLIQEGDRVEVTGHASVRAVRRRTSPSYCAIHPHPRHI